MKFVLKREGIEPKSWDFEPTKLMSVECIEIEKRTGLDFPDWLQKFKAGNMGAIHAYLFVMMKRERPGIKWEDIRFTFDDVDFEVEDSDRQEAREKIQRRIDSGEATAEELALFDSLGEQLGDAEAPKE